MRSLLVPFLIAWVVSLGLTPWVRGVALRRQILDRPDGIRKLHKGFVPLWGGVAVFLSLVLALVAARYGSFGTGRLLDDLIRTIIPPTGMVCLFGAIDDCRRLSPRIKLLLQFTAVLPAILLGCRVHRIVVFGCPIELGWLGVPLTICWLVGCINALNLLDGMDGLASLVGLFTAVMMGLIAVTDGNPHVAVVAMVLAGALAGFLVYNLPAGHDLLGRLGEHGDRAGGGALGRARRAEELGHAGDHRSGDHHGPADLRHRAGPDPPQAHRTAVRHGRPPAHSPSAAGPRADSLAGVVRVGGGMPLDRGRRGNGHAAAQRRPGLDRHDHLAGAGHPPAAVWGLRVFAGQAGGP